MELSAGESRLPAAIASTGSYEKFKTVKLGSIEIAGAGVAILALHPVNEGWHPINLRSLRLTPIQ